MDPEDTEDEDNADEMGESGGMRARPQPRKPSTQEVEAHMIDHYPFRSWCRYCVMAASRSDHHRRQAEDYNEVPVISCDYVFFTDSRDDEESQLTEAEAIAVGATPILVIRSKMIHADCVRCKGIEDEFPIETTTKWILGLGYPEVIIRTDGESSIVALSRRVGEKLKEAGVKTMHNTSPAYDSRSAGDAESGVRIVKEKVRTLICVARELHGVTIGKSHVTLPWCVIFAAQIISRSHRGTDGMTSYRRAHDRSKMPRRYVPWSEKVFNLEQPKRKVQVEAKWHEGFSSESKTNQRSLWLERHTELLFREAFAEFQKRILEMVCCSTASEETRGNCNPELKVELRTGCSWMSRLQSQRDKPHRRQLVNSCQDEFTSDD